MSKFIKTGLLIVSIIVGSIIGSLVNGIIIKYSGQIIPPPQGVNLTTMEGLQAGMHLFQPINFLCPFIAHAFGTFIGAFTACLVIFQLSHSYKRIVVMIISALYFVGGAYMVYLLPAPMWFNIVDLSLAYFPMGILAYLVSIKIK